MLQTIYFLPHGMQIIPNLEEPYNEKFRKLHDSMENIRNDIENNRSDVIILITPHGMSLSDEFLIYLHSAFQGFFYQVSDTSVVYGNLKYHHNWSGDFKFSEHLLDKFREANLASSVLIQGFPEYPLTLAWGETVPLHYIAGEKLPKLVVLSIPRKRFKKIQDMQRDLNKIGSILYKIAKSSNKKVCVVISGDLSHVHQKDSPYGYHHSGAIFDNLVQEWAKNPSQEKLQKLLELQKTALACGMAGISILQGIFDNNQVSNESLMYDLPSYFGMLISKWKVI